MGDDLVEYWFGIGDGAVSTWRSPSAQGVVPLDFDGDGRIDDAMLDLDSDGRADVAALDLDDDGVTEARFRDDGTGVWGRRDAAEPRGAPSTCPVPASPPASAPDAAPKKAADQSVTPLPAEPGRPARQAVVDTDGDGTPDVLLFDADGDGAADGAVHPRN